jgi:hypothetical protein
MVYGNGFRRRRDCHGYRAISGTIPHARRAGEWLAPNFPPIAALLVTRWRCCVPMRAVEKIGEHEMSPTRYFLVQQNDSWMIKFADEEFGPYKSKSEAMLFAVEAARKLAERGAETEVCLMGENGFFHAEWSNTQPAAASA